MFTRGDTHLIFELSKIFTPTGDTLLEIFSVNTVETHNSTVESFAKVYERGEEPEDEYR